VSAFDIPENVLNALFLALYQPYLKIAWKCAIFGVDVRLENFEK